MVEHSLDRLIAIRPIAGLHCITPVADKNMVPYFDPVTRSKAPFFRFFPVQADSGFRQDLEKIPPVISADLDGCPGNGCIVQNDIALF
jgi:hypothetical protein